MTNYLRSEGYRLRKNKLIPVFLFLTALLIIAADLALVFFDSFDPNFPYAHSKFFYSNALGMSLLLYLIGYLLSSVLLGKDKKVIKVSVASGIKRETILWGKLLLSIATYMIVGMLLTAIMIFIGEYTLAPTHDHVAQYFIISMVNMLPILLSAFIVSFLFNLANMKDAIGIVAILAIYMFSGGIFRYLANKHSIFEWLYTYSPSGLMEKNLFQYLDDETTWMLETWLVGIIISVIAIIIGLYRFKKIDL